MNKLQERSIRTLEDLIEYSSVESLLVKSILQTISLPYDRIVTSHEIADILDAEFKKYLNFAVGIEILEPEPKFHNHLLLSPVSNVGDKLNKIDFVVHKLTYTLLGELVTAA